MNGLRQPQNLSLSRGFLLAEPFVPGLFWQPLLLNWLQMLFPTRLGLILGSLHFAVRVAPRLPAQCFTWTLISWPEHWERDHIALPNSRKSDSKQSIGQPGLAMYLKRL